MSLIKDLLERPFDQAITSKYTAMNGLIYLGVGTLVLIWPGRIPNERVEGIKIKCRTSLYTLCALLCTIIIHYKLYYSMYIRQYL